MPVTRGRQLPLVLRDTTNNPKPKRQKIDVACNRDIQRTAYERLKTIRAANGGKPKRGDMTIVVNEFKNTIYSEIVTYTMLRYRSTLEKNDKPAFPTNDDDNNNNNNEAEEEIDDGENDENEENDNNNNTNNNNNTIRTITPPKPSYNKILQLVTSSYHIEYKKYNAIDKQVPRGTLNNIINTITSIHGTPTKVITLKKVLYRIHNDNVEGKHNSAPIHEKEYDIACMVEELSKLDKPISKNEIIKSVMMIKRHNNIYFCMLIYCVHIVQRPIMRCYDLNDD